MKKFIWLLRRELWEARVVWIAPAICALIVVGGALIVAFGGGNLRIDGADLAQYQSGMDPQQLDGLASLALAAMALPFFVTVLFTQFFYATDALCSERRDRSILFWKSLPVSDAATVLSKLAIAAIALPVVAALAALASELAVFIIASARLSAVPGLVAHLWQPVVWGTWLVVLAYLLVASILWYLPLIAWLLLVSAWAPRSPFMYSVLPPLALALGEYIVFRSHWVMSVVGERIGNTGFLARAMGGYDHRGGFGVVVDNQNVTLPHAVSLPLQPLQFLGSPAVWLGVLFAAAAVAGAIWMRRYRDSTT